MKLISFKTYSALVSKRVKIILQIDVLTFAKICHNHDSMRPQNTQPAEVVEVSTWSPDPDHNWSSLEAPNNTRPEVTDRSDLRNYSWVFTDYFV